MNTLLVTSRVTLVPDNYDSLVVGLASCPQIGGLLVLDNGGTRLLRKVLWLCLAGAPRLGRIFLQNRFGRSMARRRTAYAAAGKGVWMLPAINSAEACALVREHGFDLLLNARTRSIYRREILSAPRMGCLNIHHGLLPEQRGILCDLWALSAGRPTGFSIHVMTPAVDAGPIAARETVAAGCERDYPSYLSKAARRECEVAAALLEHIAVTGRIETETNRAPPELLPGRDPTRAQLRAMRRKGMLL